MLAGFGRIRAHAASMFFVGCGLMLGTSQAEVPGHRIRALMDSGRIAENSPVLLTGRVESAPEPSPQGFFVRLEVRTAEVGGSHMDVSGVVRIFISTVSEESRERFRRMDPRAGDMLRAAVRLERGDRYLNPGVVRAPEMLDQQGIDAAARLKSSLLTEVVTRDRRILPDVRSLRNTIIEKMVGIFPQPVSGVMIASLLGNGYYLDKRTGDLFREGGTFHVLVISGLHITFIGGLLLVLSSCVTSDRRAQAVFAAGCLWAYSFAVGAEVPVLRAVVMFSVMLAGRMLRRDVSTLNSLGCTALILLIWRPLDIYSPSFQLTFLSVWAIAGIAMPLVEKMKAVGAWTPTRSEPLPPRVRGLFKRFCETLYWREEKWEFELRRSVWSGVIFKHPFLNGRIHGPWQTVLVFLFEGMVYSAVVQTAMLPVQIYYFHRVSLGGVILDLWVGAFIAVESFLAVAAVAVAFVSDRAAVPLVQLTEVTNSMLFFLPEILSDMEVASMRVPLARAFVPVSIAMGISVTAISVMILAWSPFGRWVPLGMSPRRLVMTSVGAAFVCMALLITNPFGPKFEKGVLRVDFLDVGQGDAVFVTFPDGTTMLVDGGGRPKMLVPGGVDGDAVFEPDTREVGEAVVSEFLWERGYSRVDYLVATHADTDHMQGLVAVVGNFVVDRALVGRMADGDSDFDSLLEALARKGIEPESVGAGDLLHIGGAEVRFLHPVRDEGRYSPGSNSESIVMMLSFGSRRILLTGDLEKEGEARLLASGTSLPADVVKVGHHGSRTSSSEEFVRAVDADYAVVSVGRKSPFGHPHIEVVSRWRAAGTRVIETGSGGTVTVNTDGRALSVTTFAASLK